MDLSLLPPELLQLIVFHLTDQTVKSLSQTNHWFHHLLHNIWKNKNGKFWKNRYSTAVCRPSEAVPPTSYIEHYGWRTLYYRLLTWDRPGGSSYHIGPLGHLYHHSANKEHLLHRVDMERVLYHAGDFSSITLVYLTLSSECRCLVGQMQQDLSFLRYEAVLFDQVIKSYQSRELIVCLTQDGTVFTNRDRSLLGQITVVNGKSIMEKTGFARYSSLATGGNALGNSILHIGTFEVSYLSEGIQIFSWRRDSKTMLQLLAREVERRLAQYDGA